MKAITILIWAILYTQFNFFQKKDSPIITKIPKDYFIHATPEGNSDLQIYMCTKCFFEIKYIRNETVDHYKDFFNINGRILNIKELIDAENLEFYNVLYSGNKYLLAISPNFGASGYKSSKYKNYYLFLLDKKNKVKWVKKITDSKLVMQTVFLRMK